MWKAWSRDQIIAGVQKAIQEMPTGSSRDLTVRLRYLELLCKLVGAYHAPAEAVPAGSNVIVVTREQSDELWKKRAIDQQRHLGKSSSLATNTR